MSVTTLSKSIFLTATPETVWRFLTEKEKLGQWFHPSKEDLTEGREYELLETGDDGISKTVCWGTVVSMDEPNSMQWTFTVTPLGGAMTTVHWKLEAMTGGTRLTLTHEGVSEAAGESALGLLIALDKGWDEHFMSMRSVVSALNAKQ